MRFAPFFFFFFLNFGLTRPFRPIPADTDQVGPIWAVSAPILATSAPILAASARFGNRHVARRGTDAQSAASLPRRRVPPRRTRVRSPGSRVRAFLIDTHIVFIIPPLLWVIIILSLKSPTPHTRKILNISSICFNLKQFST